MFQVCVMAIAGVIASLMIKRDKPEYSTIITILVGIYIAYRVLALVGSVMEEIEGWKNIIGDNSVYVRLLLKLIGITYICEFASNMCRDSGHLALGKHIELFGKVAVMAAGFPIVRTMVEMLENIIG